MQFVEGDYAGKAWGQWPDEGWEASLPSQPTTLHRTTSENMWKQVQRLPLTNSFHDNTVPY